MRIKPSDSQVIQQKKNGFRIPIINERFLTQFIKVLASNHEFKRKEINNFTNFISSIDRDFYSKDINVYALILAIDILISCQLDGESDKDAIISRMTVEIPDAYADIKENIIYPTILQADETVQDRDVLFVTKTINTYTKFGSVISKKDKFADMVSDISSGNVNNLEASLENFRDLITDMVDDFKVSDSTNEKFQLTHTSNEDFIENTLRDTWKQMTSPKINIKTGIKRFNEMLSMQGGFLGGKLYIFYADTNSFKSALLLYISKWIQQYNSDSFFEEFLITKKRPTVLYISLENGDVEDAQREFTAFTKRDIQSVGTFENVKDLWMQHYNATSSIVDITMLHTEDNMFSCKDLKQVAQRVEDDGYKIISILIDSLDLMAPNDEDKYAEERIKFSGIAKSLAKFAKDQPYPVITVHQLNRDGNKSITEKKSTGSVNLAKSLGRQFISGAYDIERRAAFSGFIYLETSPYDGKLYLEIKREKCRYKRTDIEFFAHELINGFIIEDDINDEEYKSILSIAPTDDGGMYGNKEMVGGRGVTSIKNPMSGVPNTVKETINKEELEKAKQENMLKMAYAWCYATNFIDQDFVSFNNSDCIVECDPYTQYDEYGFPL